MEKAMNISFGRIPSQEEYHNLIGPCGIRPIGIGKRHRAKLAAWDACRKQAQDDKAAGRKAEASSSASTDAAIAALSAPDTSAAASAPGESAPGAMPGAGAGGKPKASGMGMGAIIGIAVAAIVVVGGIIMLATKKPAPSAA